MTFDDWRTEGFDTADLQEVKALLDELGGYNRRTQHATAPEHPRRSHRCHTHVAAKYPASP
jgi:hypothetical protein